MTNYKTARKKISTAVANGVLWAEGIGNLPVVAESKEGNLVEIELKDVQLCPNGNCKPNFDVPGGRPRLHALRVLTRGCGVCPSGRR